MTDSEQNNNHGLQYSMQIPNRNNHAINESEVSTSLVQMNRIHHSNRNLNRVMGIELHGDNRLDHNYNFTNDNRSVSSVSGASSGTRSSTLTRVRDIMTGKDKEITCPLTIILVRQCAREEIWNHVKFLPNDCIKNIDVENKTNNKMNVLYILLKRVRRLNDSTFEKLRFWEHYAREVQKELNTMKSTCTKQIKDNLTKGMFHKFIT